MGLMRRTTRVACDRSGRQSAQSCLRGHSRWSSGPVARPIDETGAAVSLAHTRCASRGRWASAAPLRADYLPVMGGAGETNVQFDFLPNYGYHLEPNHANNLSREFEPGRFGHFPGAWHSPIPSIVPAEFFTSLDATLAITVGSAERLIGRALPVDAAMRVRARCAGPRAWWRPACAR